MGKDKAPYLDRLGYVHSVDFKVGERAAWHVFVLFVVAVKQVSSVDSDANGTLRNGTDP